MGHIWAGTFDTASSATRLLGEKNPKLRKNPKDLVTTQVFLYLYSLASFSNFLSLLI